MSARSSAAATVVLLRTTELNPHVVAFADMLEQFSGHEVAYVVDARSGPARDKGRPVVGVSREGCRAIGLHCPPGFAWSCGDYGFYLARRMLPHGQMFWMIEHDVRLSTREASDFFAFFAARPDVDLLTSYLGDAGPEWFWSRTVVARRLAAKRCFFPVTRLSGRAVDVLYDKRVRHSHRWARRVLWPNDEAMVATTLADAGLVCRDINAFGRSFYEADTFSYANLIDGDALDLSGGSGCLYHPVLYGEQYAAKLRWLAAAKVDEPPAAQQRAQRWAKRLNRLSAW